MKIFTLALLFGSALFFLSVGFAQSRQTPFALTIAAAQAEVPRGSEAKINTTITNLSNSAVALEFKNPLCDYSVEVRDSMGNLAPDTDLKKSLDCANVSGRHINAYLQPHESFKDAIPVNSLNDISEVGEYSVRVTWKAPREFGGMVVKSNTTKITVVP
jgi:hypothetical protein